MSDIHYIAPPADSYKLLTPFSLSNENGTVWAISFQARQGQFINASLSVIFTLVFAWLWGLIAAATIYLAPHRFSRRRLVALVALRNSSEPWSAFWAFVTFTADSMGCCRPRPRRSTTSTTEQKPSTRSDTLFGFMLVLLALIVVISSVVMGVVGPPLLQLGPVAPVNPNILYFANATSFGNSRGSVEAATYRAIRGDTSIRALSSVAISRDATRRRVRLEPDTSFNTPDQFRLTYDYAVTGPELGLRSAPDLVLSVSGACRTEYTWQNASADGTNESYSIFGERNNTFRVLYRAPYTDLPPQTIFTTPKGPTTNREQRNRGNMTFAIVSSIGGHNSTTENLSDPWYRAEYVEGRNRTGLSPAYQIKTGRPALSCWQADTWTCCGGQERKGHVNIKELIPLGLQVPDILLEILRTAFIPPLPQRLGADAGPSALGSLMTAGSALVDGVLNAERSSIGDDLERLILASYIATRNTLVETALYKVSEPQLLNTNLFRDPVSHELRDGAGDFLVRSPDVAAFNLAGLVAMVSISIFLLIIKVVLVLKLFFFSDNPHALPSGRSVEDIREMVDPNLQTEQFNQDRWARFKVFSAVHLLRNTYEDGTGVADKDWPCSEELPEPSDAKPLRLVQCKHGDAGCAGHIATDPELLGVAATGKRSKTNSVNHDSMMTFNSEAPLFKSEYQVNSRRPTGGYGPVRQDDLRSPYVPSPGSIDATVNQNTEYFGAAGYASAPLPQQTPPLASPGSISSSLQSPPMQTPQSPPQAQARPPLNPSHRYSQPQTQQPPAEGGPYSSAYHEEIPLQVQSPLLGNPTHYGNNHGGGR